MSSSRDTSTGQDTSASRDASTGQDTSASQGSSTGRDTSANQDTSAGQETPVSSTSQASHAGDTPPSPQPPARKYPRARTRFKSPTSAKQPLGVVEPGQRPRYRRFTPFKATRGPLDDVDIYRSQSDRPMPPAVASWERTAAPPRTSVVLSSPKEGMGSYAEALSSLRLSDQVHILGFNRDARYVAHCLSNIPGIPPPQILTQRPEIVAKWQQEGRKLIVRQLDGTVSKTDVLMPIFIGRSKRRVTPSRLKIHNLVVSTSSNAILGSLMAIRESIGPHTTICLLDEGLGVMERLNEVLFTDPSTRPTYILGYMDQRIGRHSLDPNEKFSLAIKSDGRLSLTGIPRAQPQRDSGPWVNTWAHVIGKARAQHLIKLMSSAPGLKAGGLRLDQFMRRKLPPMVLSCCADAISAALGLRFDAVARSSAAQALWNQLVFELVDIIASLPEIRTNPEVLEYFQGKNFRTELHFALSRMDGASPWIKLIRENQAVPMEFLNGYFLMRAAETSAPNATLGMIMAMVKARQQVRSEELKADIPLYRSPYMMDSDLVDAEGRPGPPIRLAYIPRNTRHPAE